ncbi:MAG TPA: dihydrolipoamide acetyltransferase family protein [bacterium]|nr:dihydrolipoamide acetyltransferase family protein [bacterium]
MMPTEVVLPRLGLTQDEGTVVRWLKPEGSRVAKGEPLFEVMTDKATLEIEAPASGVLLKILVPEGGTVAVATPIALIGEPGEAVAPAPGTRDGEAAVSGRSILPQPAAIGDPSARVKISPRARALAERHGINVRAVVGTGPDGRIIERDIQTAAASRAGGPPAPPPSTAPSSTFRPSAGQPEESPAAARMRSIIARRMMESLHTTAQLTLTTEVDMEESVRLHAEVGPELERREGVRVTYTDLIVRAAAVALREHPRINARWEGEAVRRLPEIHVGVAVSLDDGLVVPVVRQADRATLGQISAAIKDLSDRARSNRLRPEEMQGSTFTVTNLGMYDVDGFTPVLNSPDAAILGVGRLHRRPAAVGDRIEIRSMMVLSLTFDHRVVDGAPAAQFLQRVKRVLEHPYLLLLP